MTETTANNTAAPGKTELPEWVANTSTEVQYCIETWQNHAMEQEVKLTRSEYVWLKLRLAVRRGLITEEKANLIEQVDADDNSDSEDEPTEDTQPAAG